MKTFEPFLKDSVYSTSFGEDLAASTEEAINTPTLDGYPQFDGYGLTPLGFAISKELARAVGSSKKPFMDRDPRSNRYVPRWLYRGNQYFHGDYPSCFEGTVYNPATELVDEVQADAINTAANCMLNGTTAVLDANLIARSILAKIGDASPSDSERSLGLSLNLLAKIAMINDSDRDSPGRSLFNEYVGISDPRTDIIDPDDLVLKNSCGVDLDEDASEMAKFCQVRGGGCPALRSLVEYNGVTQPMIYAFWNSSVSVIVSRLFDSPVDKSPSSFNRRNKRPQ